MDSQAQNKKKTYACLFAGCTSVFNRPYRLAQHQLVHIDVKPFACNQPNCTKVYTNKSHLDRHINSVHKESVNDFLYCCPKCMKKYANRQNLKRHIKVSHTSNKKHFLCDMCKLYFKKKHQLRSHMHVHNGIKPFRCLLCEKDFVTLYDKKKHMKNHKTYECDQCNMKFNRWSALITHKKIVHRSREYICDDCGKVFKERSHIIRHIKKHKPNALKSIYFCPYENCHRHYSRNSNLKQHIRVKHEGQTFDCSICQAKLSTKAKLKKHIEQHSRPELMLRIQKTLETGRKKRKDENIFKTSSALKLAGIICKDIEEVTIPPSENAVVKC
ncbi:gastrula zinc finger protein XlCGF8.2DB-like [Vanessa tameamea]|uniref:Gastrula zinc finger protein XlCGF8.2DB-like n=1 Tax=Vanessa tameamea TaxID=334116 RepID=A0A8B8I307_VANTA